MSSRRSFDVLVLPGDGIGPEIIEQTLRVVDWYRSAYDLSINTETALVGGASIDESDMPITDEVVDKAKRADAILFGSVGGPKWDDRPRAVRPEMGILRLRKDLDLFANLRPAVHFPAVTSASPLRPELVDGADLMIVRESTAGVYFGQPRGIDSDDNGKRRAVDTQAYTEAEIVRVARAAFDIAGRRSGRLCSVDKANVMESGQLWRAVVTELARDYPDVELTHMYADNCAMQLLREPTQFDVIVTDNLFGDILSDEAAAVCGSIGLLPSATLHVGEDGKPQRALYEPIHGSAPDIAGQGIANPIAAMLSFAMCLEYSFDMAEAARGLERAISAVLGRGVCTPDIAAEGSRACSTIELGDAVLAELDNAAVSPGQVA